MAGFPRVIRMFILVMILIVGIIASGSRNNMTISPQLISVGELPVCLYQQNYYGQICCMPGQNCAPDWCQCPSDWTCSENMCIATCSSFLLQTNSGNPHDSFTYCELRSNPNRRGMPNCQCPESPQLGIVSVCGADFHKNHIQKKLCQYKKYFVPGKGNKGIGYGGGRRGRP